MIIACPICRLDLNTTNDTIPGLLFCERCQVHVSRRTGNALSPEEVRERIPSAIASHDREIDRHRRAIQFLVQLNDNL